MPEQEPKPIEEFSEKDQLLIKHIDEILAEVALPQVVDRPDYSPQLRHINRNGWRRV